MFRFTIRDVLWLMVVVGMGVGWWVEHRQREAEATKLRIELDEVNVARHKLQDAGDAAFKELRQQKLLEIERRLKMHMTPDRNSM